MAGAAAATPAMATAPTQQVQKMPEKADVIAFLAAGVSMMESDETRQLLKDTATCSRPGQALIDLQRAGWPKLGIDADVGCGHLDKLEEHFAGETVQELLELREKFIVTSMKTYLRSLYDRKPEELERRKPIPRETFVEFFDASNTKMQLPDFKKRLVQHLTDTGKPPNGFIIEAQRELLECLGFEADHGCQLLSKSLEEASKRGDNDFAHRFKMWQVTAERACHEAIRVYTAAGGEVKGMPSGPVGQQSFPPEFLEVRQEAVKEIETMSPKERGEFLMQMQKRVQIFSSLPPDAKSKHAQKMSKAERLDFVKVQLLAASLLQQRQGAGGYPAAPAPSGPVSKPAQQQMM